MLSFASNRSSLLYRIALSVRMNQMRRKKSAALSPHTSSTAGEGRVLRSRSGRVVTEQALSEAVQQAATLCAPSKSGAALARGLGTAADAPLHHVEKPAEASDNVSPKRQCRSRPARAGAAQPTCSPAPAPAQDATQGANAARPEGTAHPALTLAAAPAAWTEASMASALEHLCKADPRLAALIGEHGPAHKLLPTTTDSAFHALANVIISQQLSIHAAKNISNRVAAAAGGAEQLEPEAMLQLSTAQLRECGLSGQKTAYIQDIAQRFSSGEFTTARIVAMDDEELYRELCAVKGIGRWSVDMFSMFHCGRQDILPVGDLGVRKGFQTLYSLKVVPSVEQMEAISEKWRPYRSLGSYYMWRVPSPRTPKKKKPEQVGVTL